LKREYTSYPITDFYHFKYQLLYFAKRFSNFCFLDNHDYDFDKSYECLAGFGISKSITARKESGLQELDVFREENKDWIFGHVAYDLKNNFEALSSENPDEIGFPDFQFFVPEIVITLSKYKAEIGILPGIDGASIFQEIISIVPDEKDAIKISLKKRFSKDEYLETVKKLQQHILRGDCYEICFCQELYAKNAQIDPLKTFRKLSELSPNPFSSFYRSGKKYLMCASPERFLKKTNNTIISQPVKGTSRRDNMEVEDENEKMLLQQSEKERAENTMIVDLVRNDLSKICAEGSVSVKEFLKIYSFPLVHQMISTISGSLRENISFSEILSATFPMGSMTGAPKKRAMELIEKYEKTKRGLFSGTVGYINPAGDFDFNVVIRSVLYNKEKKYISIQVGSAITWKSIPEKEYEECMIKAEAMMKALE